MPDSVASVPRLPPPIPPPIALPRCEGPKLLPFKLTAHHQIEFLERISADDVVSNETSTVFKAKIDGELYALKVFGFFRGASRPFDIVNRPTDREAQAVIGQYMDPFNAECRAYGRLKEAGHEHLALPCYGYVTLNEEQVDMMGRNMKVHHELLGFRPCYSYLDGSPAPVRALVKELVEEPQSSDWSNKQARNMMDNIKKFHQLGIMAMSTCPTLLVNRKVCDFARSITLPHFIANPELNPILNSDWDELFMHETWKKCLQDFRKVENLIEQNNKIIHDDGTAWDPPARTRGSLRRLPAGPAHLKAVPGSVPVNVRTGAWRRCKPINTWAASSSATKVTKLKLQRNPRKWPFSSKGNALYEKLNGKLAGPEAQRALMWRYQNGFIFPVGCKLEFQVINGRADPVDANEPPREDAEELSVIREVQLKKRDPNSFFGYDTTSDEDTDEHSNTGTGANVAAADTDTNNGTKTDVTTPKSE